MKAAVRIKRARPDSELSIKFKTFGPTPEELQSLASTLRNTRALKEVLGRARSRLLRIDAYLPDEAPKSERPKPPTHFRAVYVDYTNRRSLIVTGLLAKPRSPEVIETATQFRPNEEEFAEAVRLVRASSDF